MSYGPAPTRDAYDELKKIATDANLNFGRDGDLTPHALRHTDGTNMIRDGEDIMVVAELLGHSIETARRDSLPTGQDSNAPSNASPSTSSPARPDSRARQRRR